MVEEKIEIIKSLLNDNIKKEESKLGNYDLIGELLEYHWKDLEFAKKFWDKIKDRSLKFGMILFIAELCEKLGEYEERINILNERISILEDKLKDKNG